MPTNAELSERLARLEEQHAAFKVLVEERQSNNRRIIIGLAIVVVGLVAWAASQGFDLGGLAGAIS